VIHFHSSAKFNKSAAIILFEKTLVGKKNLDVIADSTIRNAIKSVFDAGQFHGDDKEIFPLILNKKVVLLVGVGQPDQNNMTSLRCTVRQAVLSSYLKSSAAIEIIPQSSDENTIRAILEGILIGGYSWDKYKTVSEKTVKVLDKDYTIVSASKRVYEETIITCQGLTLTRNLINDNADTVDADFIETTILGLIRGKKNIALEVLNRKEMKAKGLNLHLAVNQGSLKDPKLIIVKYSGAGKNQGYTALVGKGITFDTGGLNLKPTGHIETMRCDMSGAAAVIGTLKNVLALNLKANIIFAVGVAENCIGSGAYKPGDVFRGYNGKTVEILNTDAEGRLVLADALAYVEKNYKPSRFIDLATLTGACVIALGYDYTGLVSNDDDLARELVMLSQETDDRAWQLPSYSEIRDYVKSEIADLKNVGLPKGAAGTLTAAEFLRNFVNDTPWVHLDIAGTAFVDGKGRQYYSHGATGAGVRLLTAFLKQKI
jgi:leucyl aminopeptidase